MFISKLQFKNVYGLSERIITPSNINIISGQNKLGKTSILDSIQTALTNKGVRPRIVKNGETEAEMFIETDTGLSIDRKKRTGKSDYIKIKDNGVNVDSPETYLQQLFSSNQFNPIRDFIDLKDKDKSKQLLSVCNIDFPVERYREEFGEIPVEYDVNLHVLEILEKIQSKKSKYYIDREDINRTIVHNKASKESLEATLPENYDVDTYRNVNMSELYAKYHKAIEHNNGIDKLKSDINAKELNVASIEGRYLNKVNEINESYDAQKVTKQKEIDNINEQIKQLELKRMGLTTEIEGLNDKRDNEINTAKTATEDYIKNTNLAIQQAKDYLVTLEVIDAEPLKIEADNIAKMKEYIRDYDKIVDMTKTINDLQLKSDALTTKIKRARELPSILLESAKMPIDGITVENGEILINGLPIDCLNEGESYKVAIEIAKAKVGELKVILVDGFEKFCTREKILFINKAIESGLQFFITEVSDKEELTIMSLHDELIDEETYKNMYESEGK